MMKSFSKHTKVIPPTVVTILSWSWPSTIPPLIYSGTSWGPWLRKLLLGQKPQKTWGWTPFTARRKSTWFLVKLLKRRRKMRKRQLVKAILRLRWGIFFVHHILTLVLLHAHQTALLTWSREYILKIKSIKSRQDENGTLFQTDLPEIGDDNAALLAHTTGASGSTDGAGAAAPSDAPVVGSTSGIMSFKWRPHFSQLHWMQREAI